MNFCKIASGVAASAALLVTGAAVSTVHPTQVQAVNVKTPGKRMHTKKYNYMVDVHAAPIYNSKGHRKAGIVYLGMTMFEPKGTRRIKGKQYYYLGKDNYIRKSDCCKVSTWLKNH